jgi:hypothetical protein
MEPIGCPETSVRICHCSLSKSPEERSSHLPRIGSLKPRIGYLTFLGILLLFLGILLLFLCIILFLGILLLFLYLLFFCFISNSGFTFVLYFRNVIFVLIYVGHAVEQWLRHCATKRKAAGSIPDGVIGMFHWYNHSGRTMTLGSTQPLTEMSKGKCHSITGHHGPRGGVRYSPTHFQPRR